MFIDKTVTSLLIGPRLLTNNDSFDTRLSQFLMIFRVFDDFPCLCHRSQPPDFESAANNHILVKTVKTTKIRPVWPTVWSKLTVLDTTVNTRGGNTFRGLLTPKPTVR